MHEAIMYTCFVILPHNFIPFALWPVETLECVVKSLIVLEIVKCESH